ncbi:hypothetical protein B484DRAFT_412035, partial [Ochromonadaceae sp. CCMP2298]
REITVYGYVRGSHLKPSMKFHLIGAGDFAISAICALEDPCPVQGAGTVGGGGLHVGAGAAPKVASTLKIKKDSLDGTYIELKHVHYSKQQQLYLADQHKHAERGFVGG